MDFSYAVLPALIVLFGIPIVWLSILRFRHLGSKSYGFWRRLIERIVLSFLILIAATATASSGFNAIMLYRYRHPAPGLMYTVDGHRMRIDCIGSGSPTIILEAGAGEDGLEWEGVQPVLAKTTRVCSYDRAGMGWSDPLPGPRDANHIAEELHGLLDAAKIDDSLVLMGHSLGGMLIRVYASRYPEKVVGLVFVDSYTPLLHRNPVVKRFDSRGSATPLELLLNRTAFILGVPRLIGACSGPISGLDVPAALVRHADQCHEPFQAIKAESDSLDLSDEEGLHTGPYGAMPILILSADPVTQAANGLPADLLKVGYEAQDGLKKLSSRSRRIIAKGSGHNIPRNRPDLIEKQVALFVEQIRGTVPQPADYGSTTEQ